MIKFKEIFQSTSPCAKDANKTSQHVEIKKSYWKSSIASLGQKGEVSQDK